MELKKTSNTKEGFLRTLFSKKIPEPIIAFSIALMIGMMFGFDSMLFYMTVGAFVLISIFAAMGFYRNKNK